MSLGGSLAVSALLILGTPGDVLDRQHGAWKAEAASLTYQGTDLYTFMDGGAEIYLEYGFERLESQIYQRGSDELTVELFRMRDDAYGLFTFLRPANAEKVAVGDAAFLAGYYLVLVRGPFLCTLTAQSAFPGSRDALLEVAGSIASRLEGATKIPHALSLLPARARVEASEKQLRGAIGLRNVSPMAGDLFSGFSNGAVATYEQGCLGGLLEWSDASLADQAWARALARVDREGAGGGSEADGLLRRVDGQARLVAARAGAFVVFAAGEDAQRAEELIVRLEASVGGRQPELGEGEQR